MLWLMLALTAFTAVQRFVRVYRQAAPPARTDRERRLRPRRRVEPGRPTPLRIVVDGAAGRRRSGRARRPRSERRGARP